MQYVHGAKYAQQNYRRWAQRHTAQGRKKWSEDEQEQTKKKLINILHLESKALFFSLLLFFYYFHFNVDNILTFGLFIFVCFTWISTLLLRWLAFFCVAFAKAMRFSAKCMILFWMRQQMRKKERREKYYVQVLNFLVNRLTVRQWILSMVEYLLVELCARVCACVFCFVIVYADEMSSGWSSPCTRYSSCHVELYALGKSFRCVDRGNGKSGKFNFTMDAGQCLSNALCVRLGRRLELWKYDHLCAQMFQVEFTTHCVNDGKLQNRSNLTAKWWRNLTSESYCGIGQFCEWEKLIETQKTGKMFSRCSAASRILHSRKSTLALSVSDAFDSEVLASKLHWD